MINWHLVNGPWLCSVLTKGERLPICFALLIPMLFYRFVYFIYLVPICFVLTTVGSKLSDMLHVV